MKALSVVLVLLFTSMATAGDIPVYETITTWNNYAIRFDEISGIRVYINPDKSAAVKSVQVYVRNEKEIFYWFCHKGETHIRQKQN
ncbi:MAG: hypothetical protein C4519_24445 [Desulfobacteraceae bacterium]|nr:MAG: hypothetical protein C4519_24445 [Desulfobacteraceae bacterium]